MDKAPAQPNQPSNLPQGFTCPMCQNVLPLGVSILGRKDVRVIKGMIVICSNCSGILILGDSKLMPMKKQDFDSRPEKVQELLKKAVAAVRRTQAIQSQKN